jgi:hypothetical protein
MMTAITCMLEQLLNAVPALAWLAGERLPIKVSYHLTKVRKHVDREAGEFEEARVALIKELGVERQPTLKEIRNGQRATEPITEVPPDKREEFQARMRELLAVEITIPLRPIELPESLTIASGHLAALEPFVTVPGAEETTT